MFPPALFYETAYGLRFDLGGDLSMGPLRFLQAIDRARAIVEAVFRDSREVTAIVGQYGGEKRTRRHSAAFAQLREMGFDHVFELQEKKSQGDKEYIAEFGEDLWQYVYSVDFPKSLAATNALLWAIIAQEMPIAPKARWIGRVHIADFHRGLSICVYDDRGMDVVATRPERLAELYRSFDAWLLDYDRAAMADRFGQQS